MDNALSNREFLEKLSKSRSLQKRNKMLADASAEEILTLLEITINMLKFRIKLTNQQKKKLAHHADYLRKLSRARSEKTTRNILQQDGGSVLPSLVLSFLKCTV